jgi:Flp pilus assembly protein TadD
MRNYLYFLFSLLIIALLAGCNDNGQNEGMTEEEKLAEVVRLNNEAKELYNKAKTESGSSRESMMNTAIAYLDSSLMLDSSNLASYTLSTQLLCFQGKFEKALLVLEAAGRYHPNVVEAIITKGLVLDTLGRSEDAAITYNHAIEVSKNKAGSDEETRIMETINQAHITMLLGDTERAILMLDTLETERDDLNEIIDFHKDRITKKGRKFLTDLVFGKI